MSSIPPRAVKAVRKTATKPRSKVAAKPIVDEMPFGCVAQSATEWISSCESADQLVCLVDTDGRVIYANRCAERWDLIDDASRAIGMDLHALVHPGCVDAACQFRSVSGEVASAIKRNRIELREVDDHILDRHFEMMVAPVQISRDMSGQGVRDAAIVQVSDVTSQKRTENWLRDSVDELNQELKRRTAALETATEQNQRAETALRRAESELKLVSAALMTMQEMERKRIATELHDSIGQSLTALSFSVSNALSASERGDRKGTRDFLEKLVPQVKETIAEVRRIAMDLRPTTLDDLGIIGTLSWFFREFRVVHADINLLSDIRLQEKEVVPALRTTLFRVVQEAVNNALKHSKASEITLRLWSTDSAIHLEIEDNGCGFSLANIQKGGGMGMGLKSMRDRAEFSGGEFRIESEPGKGTRLSASWPRRLS